MYTFCGRKGRILQVHFHEGQLHVLKSRWLDFTEEDYVNINLMYRWMIVKPIGDTTYEALYPQKATEDSSEASSENLSEEAHQEPSQVPNILITSCDA